MPTRKRFTETVAFRLDRKAKARLDEVCEGLNLKPSELLRANLGKILDDNCNKGKEKSE